MQKAFKSDATHIYILVILGSQFKIAFRVVTHGAKFGCLFANHNVSAVRALPNALALAREHHAVFDILQQFAIAFLVQFFDSTHHSNFAAISAKPSSRASRAKVAYMSVHS